MNYRIKTPIVALICLWGLLVAFGVAVFAQGYTLEFPIPQVPATTDLPGYLGGLFKFGLAVVGITALASIMIGGIRYVGSELITTKQDAKDQISSAIYGLLLLLFSYLILNTINPELVSLKSPSLSPLPVTQPTPTPTSTVPPDSSFTYDSGIQNQLGDASPQLTQLMNCISSKVPGDVGRVSSISDSAGFSTCSLNYSKPPCAHASTSCHYGGSCKDKSYAVDFGDEQNFDTLRTTAKQCNPNAYVLNESNHTHISIGAASGCNCN